MIVYDSKLSIDHVKFDKNSNLRQYRQAFKYNFSLNSLLKIHIYNF